MEDDALKKRIWAKGLLMGCPFEVELDDCPLKDIRKLDMRERLSIVNGMDEVELDAVLGHHWKCQKARKK